MTDPYPDYDTGKTALADVCAAPMLLVMSACIADADIIFSPKNRHPGTIAQLTNGRPKMETTKIVFVV